VLPENADDVVVDAPAIACVDEVAEKSAPQAAPLRLGTTARDSISPTCSPVAQVSASQVSPAGSTWARP